MAHPLASSGITEDSVLKPTYNSTLFLHQVFLGWGITFVHLGFFKNLMHEYCTYIISTPLFPTSNFSYVATHDLLLLLLDYYC